MKADKAADLLAELMHGRDRSELAGVLRDALTDYELARLCAVAGSRLGALNGARARQAGLENGTIRPQNE